MLKIGAVLVYALSVAESALGSRWLCQAKENDWDPRRIFFAVTCYLNAIMQCMMAGQLWRAAEEEDADLDDFED